MKKSRTYRLLTDQTEEYEVETKYLGWTCDQEDNWMEWFDMKNKWGPEELIKHNPPLQLTFRNKDESVCLVMHERILNDHNPLENYKHSNSHEWYIFGIVSTTQDLNRRFVIPLG